MAVTRRTLRLMRIIRAEVDSLIDAVDEDLVRAWARAWDALLVEWDAAVEELQSIRDDGAWPSRSQVRRSDQAMKALSLTRTALDDLTDNASTRILQGAPGTVGLAAGHVDVIASQYPPNERAFLKFASAVVLEEILRGTAKRVALLLAPMAAGVIGGMFPILVRGPGRSRMPLTRRLEMAFNKGLTKTMTVAGTELVDSHRAAVASHHRANADVLIPGYIWHAILDKRTCGICWWAHGRFFPNGQGPGQFFADQGGEMFDGPFDHPRGRCMRLPMLKSWAELGFEGRDEPEDEAVDSQMLFRALPREDQLRIMGPTRLALLDSGDVAWVDLGMRKSNRGWRDSYALIPVRDLTR